MATVRTIPFNQNIRINLLRVAAIATFPLALSFTPWLDDTMPGEVMEQFGILLIVGGVLIRFWAILYIGNHKNHSIMQDGPYSICRHPLYLGSTLAVFGFGLMLESIIFAVAITMVVFLILNRTSKKEEQFLHHKFGQAYNDYADIMPGIVPNLALFRTKSDVEFNVGALRRNFLDALVFLSLIPMVEVIEIIRESNIFPQFGLL